MIYLQSMIKLSLLLAWMKRIFGTREGAWKSYLRFLLELFGVLFLFYCNYDVKDLSIPSQFIPVYLNGGQNSWWIWYKKGVEIYSLE